MTFRFVESPNVTHATARVVDVVVIHTMEIPERPDAAELCAQWFASPASRVSAHYCVDSGSIVQCVREEDIAWHARGGNARSIGVELAGMAGQGSKDWDDDYSAAVLDRAARLIGEICSRHRIPVRWLDPPDLLDGRRGITGHVDVSHAFRKSDHWDPGPGFPRARFLARVRGAQARSGQRVGPPT